MEGKKRDITTIQVSKTLKAKLDSLGKKGDTYEVIIDKLINEKSPSKSKKVYKQ